MPRMAIQAIAQMRAEGRGQARDRRAGNARVDDRFLALHTLAVALRQRGVFGVAHACLVPAWRSPSATTAIA